MQSIKRNILNHPYFRFNTPNINRLLFLLVLFIAVAGADLSSELAKEKNEIGAIADILNESLASDEPDAIKLLGFNPIENGVIPPTPLTISDNDVTALPPERAPPIPKI